MFFLSEKKRSKKIRKRNCLDNNLVACVQFTGSDCKVTHTQTQAHAMMETIKSHDPSSNNEGGIEVKSEHCVKERTHRVGSHGDNVYPRRRHGYLVAADWPGKNELRHGAHHLCEAE